MFYKGYVIGASFSRGLGLHFYDRVKRNKKCNYNCNYMEHLFNYKNSFSFITNEKLDISWPIIASQVTFFDEIDWVSEQIQNETKDDYFKTNKISKYANFRMYFKSISLITFYFGSYATLFFFNDSFLSLVLWFMMGIGMSGIGMSVMHDANHGAYSKNKNAIIILKKAIAKHPMSNFNDKNNSPKE